MRERHVLRDDVAVNLRITPARAGKTRPACHRHERRQDHPRSCGKDVPSHSTSRPQDGSPRSCGKDIFQLYWISLNLGSPPLVRERLYVTDNLSVHTGITPARAGKTWVFCYGVWVKWDHPRSCGKDSNGFLYFRPFTLTDVQNLFNFFAKHLTSSASPNAR